MIFDALMGSIFLFYLAFRAENLSTFPKALRYALSGKLVANGAECPAGVTPSIGILFLRRQSSFCNGTLRFITLPRIRFRTRCYKRLSLLEFCPDTKNLMTSPLRTGGKTVTTTARRRGVAQPGSASALGAEGRMFESCRPDHINSIKSMLNLSASQRVAALFTPRSRNLLQEAVICPFYSISGAPCRKSA